MTKRESAVAAREEAVLTREEAARLREEVIRARDETTRVKSELEELMVQVADGRVQSWSTDPRARTPLLPALDTNSDPACLLTVRDGQELYASGALGA